MYFTHSFHILNAFTFSSNYFIISNGVKKSSRGAGREGGREGDFQVELCPGPKGYMAYFLS